jgi:hypothetical protein
MIRSDVINLLIQKRKYQTYLEIGFSTGENFTKIKCTRKVAVDPFVSHPHCIKKYSENYLTECIELGIKFDCIFIDGDHRAEYVYKDAILGLQALNPNGVLVFHDVNPPDEWHTRPIEQFGAGDAWCGTAYIGFLQTISENQYHHFTIPEDYGVGIIDTSKEKEIEVSIPKTWALFDKNRNRLLNFIKASDLA